MTDRFDRAAENVGNIVRLEHVNTSVPDQQLATLFYVTGLGLTRDPYLMTGTNNMWINVGQGQFHLPTGRPMVLRGRTGLVLPDREALLRRLASVQKALADTRFGFREEDGFVEATCPWGNRIRCHSPEGRFGRMNLGMPYVELDVAPGTAAGIARFYEEVLRAPAMAASDGRGAYARVSVGPAQDLLFRETEEPPAAYDGHHFQIYIADFGGPYRRLRERNLVTMETNEHEYRFRDIVDCESGATLFTVEHEVRSMRHPLHARPLVNRNPAQTNTDYIEGQDDFSWAVFRGSPSG